MLASAISRVGRVRSMLGPLNDFWYRSTPTKGAGDVTDASAMSVSTVFACIRVLSDTIGALPWKVYKRISDDEKQQDKSNEFYATLHDRPNLWQTAIDWRAMGVAHLCLRGNFYNRIDPPTRYNDSPSFVPLNPDRMHIDQMNSGSLKYTYTYADGHKEEYTDADILHVKLMTLDGLHGVAPLGYARETIGLTSSRTRHANSLFNGGGFFKYYLKTTKKLGVEGRKNFRESWRDLHGDPENYTPPLLEDDLDIKTLGMSQEDAQWIESQKYGAVEVCQFFGVPPHLVFLLDRATYSNIEQQSLEFLTIHLNPWLVRFEQAVQPWLADGTFSEFSRDAIIRGDIGARYEAYSKALQGRPFMVPNDVRKRENLPPVEGWSTPIDPLNMAAPGPQGQQQSPAPSQDTPDGNEDDTQQSTPESRTIELQPLIRDVAERIVKTECNGLGSRAKKAADDRRAYDTWCGEWFSKHRSYVTAAALPLFAAAGSGDAETFAASHCTESLACISVAVDVRAALDDWKENKAAAVADALTKEIGYV